LYWRQEIAPRAAVLIDVADYYAAARAAMMKARRSIHFLNWEFESPTRLVPGEGGTIGDLLKVLADQGIDVRILCWKTALPVAATQDWFPLQDRRSFAGTAVKFVLDGGHPYGACHHQKAIVIDDSVAFCGGTDIGRDRWDTDRHLDDDPGRARPNGHGCFDARHEVMALVDGPAAAALGGLFRLRWRRATGEEVPAPEPGRSDAWPDTVEADFTDVMAGISRTSAAWRGWPGEGENEALTLASIAAARRCIYIENQYFTSPVVAEALAQRLAEADGPEVVLIGTRRAPHWFDHMTMDRARGAFIHRLRRADRWGRFRVFSPATAKGRIIIVHAKLTIVDDDFVRVGSSNMNNRSTGFDTECDLSFRLDSVANRAAAARLRTRLLAHWLGCAPATVEEAIMRDGSVGAAIEALSGERRLARIEPKPLGPLASLIAAFHIGDPVGPADSFRLGLRRRRLAAVAGGLEVRP
jgi:phosphatidylserine/phosphatidylglycerophosphate/cardiolipin synthase-like enzyme